MDRRVVLKRVIGYKLEQDIPSNAKFIGTGNMKVGSPFPDKTFPLFYYEVPDKVEVKKRVSHSDAIENIVEYLNYKADKNYKSKTDKTRKLITKWLNSDYTQEDFYKMIDNMCDRWLGDDKMQQYLRPETLFGTKFEGYLNSGHGATEDDVFSELDGIIKDIH